MNFTYPEFVGVEPKDRMKAIALKAFALYGPGNKTNIVTEAIQAGDSDPVFDLDTDLYEWFVYAFRP